jgi:hypothetical protein
VEWVYVCNPSSATLRQVVGLDVCWRRGGEFAAVAGGFAFDTDALYGHSLLGINGWLILATGGGLLMYIYHWRWRYFAAAAALVVGVGLELWLLQAPYLIRPYLLLADAYGNSVTANVGSVGFGLVLAGCLAALIWLQRRVTRA